MPYTFPAVKGRQRSTEYYLSSLTYGEISNLVKLPDELEGERLLDGQQEMQRELNHGRVRNQMVPYLLENEDAFYSSLTLFIVPSDLTPAQSPKHYTFKPLSADGSGPHGTLELRGSCLLFAGDGQHRAASIRQAHEKNRQLADVEVPVVLIPFTTRERVRQLFADLNLNAKPVNRTIGLSFESRDPYALIAKGIADRIPLFDGRVNLKTNSLPATSRSVITMNSLYEATKLLVGSLQAAANGNGRRVRSARTSDEVDVNATVEQVLPAWEIITNAFPIWEEVIEGRVTPGEVREKFIFAHGLGWQAIAHAATGIIRTHPYNWTETLEDALACVQWERSNRGWQGVAMIGERVNNTKPAIQATAGYILEQAGITVGAAQPYIEALAKSRTPTDGRSN